MKKLIKVLAAVNSHKFECKHLTQRFFGNNYFYNYARIHVQAQQLFSSKRLLVDFIPYESLGEHHDQIQACRTQEQRKKVYLDLPKDAKAVKFHQAIHFGLQYAFAVYHNEKKDSAKGIKVKITDVVKNLVTDDEMMAYVSAQVLWKILKFTPKYPLEFNQESEEVNFLPEFSSTPPWRKLPPYYPSTKKLKIKLSLDEAITKVQTSPDTRSFVYGERRYVNYKDIGFGWLFSSDLYYDKSLFLQSLMGTFHLENYFDYGFGRPSPKTHIVLDKFTEEMSILLPHTEVKLYLEKYRNERNYH